MCFFRFHPGFTWASKKCTCSLRFPFKVHAEFEETRMYLSSSMQMSYGIREKKTRVFLSTSIRDPYRIRRTMRASFDLHPKKNIRESKKNTRAVLSTSIPIHRKLEETRAFCRLPSETHTEFKETQMFLSISIRDSYENRIHARGPFDFHLRTIWNSNKPCLSLDFHPKFIRNLRKRSRLFRFSYKSHGVRRRARVSSDSIQESCGIQNNEQLCHVHLESIWDSKKNDMLLWMSIKIPIEIEEARVSLSMSIQNSHRI